MFFRKIQRVAKMLITCLVAFCLEMWNVIEKCDFRFSSLQKIFLWIRSRDYVWSSNRLCFDCSTRVFSKWRTKFNSIFRNDRNLTKRLIKLDENDSSILTDNISSNLMSDISSNLMSCVSSNLTNDISLILTNDISSNLISDILSNSTKTLSVLLDKRFWMTRESMYVNWNLACYTRMSIDELRNENWFCDERSKMKAETMTKFNFSSENKCRLMSIVLLFELIICQKYKW
jgi:hypothetical protein